MVGSMEARLVSSKACIGAPLANKVLDHGLLAIYLRSRNKDRSSHRAFCGVVSSELTIAFSTQI